MFHFSVEYKTLSKTVLASAYSLRLSVCPYTRGTIPKQCHLKVNPVSVFTSHIVPNISGIASLFLKCYDFFLSCCECMKIGKVVLSNPVS